MEPQKKKNCAIYSGPYAHNILTECTGIQVGIPVKNIF